MNKQLLNPTSDSLYPGVSLQFLVDYIISNLEKTNANNKIYLKNAVAPEFRICTDQTELLPVITELLTTMIANARDTSIIITAEKFTDLFILNFEDSNNNNGYALSFSLMAVEKHARVIGGYITIAGARKKVATVSLSFPDMPVLRQPVYSN